jgi:hypothetical protein
VTGEQLFEITATDVIAQVSNIQLSTHRGSPENGPMTDVSSFALTALRRQSDNDPRRADLSDRFSSGSALGRGWLPRREHPGTEVAVLAMCEMGFSSSLSYLRLLPQFVPDASLRRQETLRQLNSVGPSIEPQ